jgi:CRISPR-associated endoribonuclease Cas6
MPSVFGLVMNAEGPIELPSPEQIHALSCSLLDEDHEHRASLKPFSVRSSRPHDRGWQIDLGLLDDRLLSRLERSLNATRGHLHLGHNQLVVSEVSLLAQASWKELIDDARPVASVGVRFITPTFFRRQRRLHVLPFPSVVFGHWRRRWDEIFGRSPDCPFDDHLMNVTRVDLNTHSLHYRNQPISAVTGEVVYDLHLLPEEHRAALHALSLLAPYAGCGSRTSAGFGAADVFIPDSSQTPTSSGSSASSPRDRRPRDVRSRRGGGSRDI